MRTILFAAVCAAIIAPVRGAVIYNNLTPNNSIGIASRPGAGVTEIEAADDFIVTGAATVTNASFTGLLFSPTGGPVNVTEIVIEMYRVFPLDSTTPPSSNVPTRLNSPSDDAFASRDSLLGELTFTSTSAGSLTTVNSVAPGGIHPSPNQTTNGNGPVTGTEVQFNITFSTPFSLPADHYFFVPQVALNNGGVFYWLSASRNPITGPGTTPFAPDLQVWTRDQALDPDWLRVGSDIVGPAVGGPTFNAAFSLDGTVAPEPSGSLLLAGGLGLIVLGRMKRKSAGQEAGVTRRA